MPQKQTKSRSLNKKKKTTAAKINIISPHHSNKNSVVIQPISTPALNQALYLAVLEGNLPKVDHLIKAGAQVDEVAGEFSSVLRRNTFLYLAAYRGEKNIVERLLSTSRTTINTPNIEGFRPLHAACQEGHSDIVSLLIQAGANTEITDDEGATPLSIAALGGRESIVDILLSTPLPGDKPDARGNTPLHAACQNGHIPIVNKLLNAGANINLANKQGNTPLHVAVIKGQAGIVNLLLSRGADPFLRNSAGKTAGECLTSDNPEKLTSEQQEDVAAALRGYKAFFHYRTKKLFLPYQLPCSDVKMFMAIGALQIILSDFNNENADQIINNLRSKLTDVNDPHYELYTTTALMHLREQLLVAIKDYSDSKKRELYRSSDVSDAIYSTVHRLRLRFFEHQANPHHLLAPPAPNTAYWPVLGGP